MDGWLLRVSPVIDEANRNDHCDIIGISPFYDDNNYLLHTSIYLKKKSGNTKISRKRSTTAKKCKNQSCGAT